MENKRIAIIRMTGEVALNKDLKDTFKLLRLYKKNNCVVVPNSPQYVGMIEKMREKSTWGEIDEPTLKLLLEKRARVSRNQQLSAEYLKAHAKTDFDSFAKDVISFKKELKDVPGMKLFFKLKPPTGGFERKGVKEQYSLGGALGYRKDNINELLRKMI